jgi:CRISPR/Cas system CMR-associated protein Cmr1 (group 7 of RAMP superfamily)
MKYSKEEKAMWVEDFKASGMSVYAYTKKNGLCQQTFKNWVEGRTVKDFVEIKASAHETALPGKDGQDLVVEVGKIKIYIPFVMTELGEIIEQLRPLICSAI